MKKLIPLLFGLLLSTLSFSQIVITEIMYNPPEPNLDTLEFIELYNTTSQTVDLSGYSFRQGIEQVPDLGTLGADSYLVICEDSIRFVEAFGNLPNLRQWTSGALTNGGEDITLIDASGTVIDSVDYDNGGDWPAEAAGGGPSLERCDLNGDSNNPGIWKASNSPTGFFRGTVEVLATPGAGPAADLCENIVTPDDLSLKITEVMYNDPGAIDSIEYIEIYNDGNVTATLTNYRLTVGTIIDYTFDQLTLEPSELMLVSKYPTKIQETFGVDSRSWGNGGISDSGDVISLFAANGVLLDSYTVNDTDSKADGTGLSWCNCDMVADVSSDLWDASTGLLAANQYSYQGMTIIASPLSTSVCDRTTSDIATLDADGRSILDGSNATLTGTITSTNFSSNGLQFSFESDSEGIFIFNDVDFGETINFEDEVMIQGFVTNFRGINQVDLDTLIKLSNLGIYDAAITVTALDEATEAEIVTLENVSLVDPTQWDTGTGSFNFTVTDGTNEYDIRVDNDTDIIGMNYPTGSFSITGVGSQFDQNAPFDAGYQLLPRFVQDIDPYVPFVNQYPTITIPEVKATNADGESTLEGQTYTISGTVHGIEFNSGGTQFYILDENEEGILISSGSTTGYTVTEGDNITVEGTVGFFRGVVDFDPDNIVVNSSGNTLFDPTDVTVLSEDTESNLVKISGLSYVDATEWNGDGSSFNVIFTDGTTDFTVRIDNDSELSTMTAPFEGSTTISIIGFGSQFDSTSPFDSGYQLFPRVIGDFNSISSTKTLLSNDAIEIFPNPVDISIKLSTEIEFDNYKIIDLQGKLIMQGVYNTDINIKSLVKGTYILRLENKDHLAIKKFIKI